MKIIVKLFILADDSALNVQQEKRTGSCGTRTRGEPCELCEASRQDRGLPASKDEMSDFSS